MMTSTLNLGLQNFEDFYDIWQQIECQWFLEIGISEWHEFPVLWYIVVRSTARNYLRPLPTLLSPFSVNSTIVIYILDWFNLSCKLNPGVVKMEFLNPRPQICLYTHTRVPKLHQPGKTIFLIQKFVPLALQTGFLF